jgi:SPP1 family predicted phage head-tail adaptor
MKAGKLALRVLIQTPTRAASGNGDYTETWPADGVGIEAWASIEPMSGSEKFYASAQGATASHKVSMRYNEDVVSTSRLVYRGRLYYVVDPPIDVWARGKEITFTVQEKVS